MQRYTYKDPLTNKTRVYYRVGRGRKTQWFYGKGCHMRALSHNNLIHPTAKLATLPYGVQ